MKCEFCQAELTRHRKRFCSKSCDDAWREKNLRQVVKVCEKCKNEYRGRPDTRNWCRSCINSWERSGENSPTWKGGHKYWQEGKLGRDKDDLSWKKQRLLAWERDNYTCQDCGKTREELGKRPDVDHIVPYRFSFSHALDNLLSRCRSCHKKEEAKRTELWNGATFPKNINILRAKRARCSDCNHPKRKPNSQGRCEPCQLHNYDIPKAKELRGRGYSYEEIGRSLGRNHKSIWNWINVGIKFTLTQEDHT
jgi:hypothetical protein